MTKYIYGFLVVVLNVFHGVVFCENCYFGENCHWQVQSGFDILDLSSLKATVCSDITCSDIGNITGDALFLDIKNGTEGLIANEWSDVASLGACIVMRIYTLDVAGSIVLKTLTESGEASISNVSVDATGTGRWQDVTLDYEKPAVKYRLSLQVNVQDTSGFLIISDITVSDHCPTSKGNDSCSGSDQFQCEDTTCIKWSSVCNLQDDCAHGKDEHICGVLPDYARCTFEDGICGWITVERVKGFSWKRHHGPSPTPGTGPDVDHTMGTTTGYYMYIEGGDGEFDDTATLQSLVMPAVDKTFQKDCKLRFFYHMIGRDIGTLTIKLINLCSKTAEDIWSQEGKQENAWKFAEIPLVDISARYIVHFDGSGAWFVHGDIAIDDVSFSPECFGITHDESVFLSVSTHQKPITIQEFRNDTKSYCNQTPGTPIIVAVKPTNGSSATNGKISPDNMENVSVTVSSAVHTTKQHPQPMGVIYIVAITLAAVVVAVIMGSVLLSLALRRRKDNPRQTARLEMVSTVSDDNCNTVPVQASSIDMQLRCAVTELNPNYDFITAKYPEQQLREIPRNKLTMIRLLGQGAFGEVYEGSLKNLCANVSELPVAVKTLPALSTEQAETDFLMEAVIISKFMHKNVVKCLGVCFEEHPRYIILELLEGGDLRTFLRDSRTRGDHKCTLVMEDLLKLTIDISNGCRHLEEKHFVHRDIAARNCLLTTCGPGRIAKIADFGMSRDIYSADYYRKGGKAMLPIKWMPPEAFLDGVFTSKTDTWSYGVLLWEIFTLGYMPYPGQTNTDVMHFIASGGRLDPPDKCPARLSKIMIMCWNSVADIRPSFSEIAELLDMCLQDEEVLNTDVSVCHYPMVECFRDASTLARVASTADDNDAISTDSHSEGATGTAAEFKGHFESQSREPLLLSSPES